MKTLFRNGTVVNCAVVRRGSCVVGPREKRQYQVEFLDVLVEDGFIKQVDTHIHDETARVVECAGLFILPGLIDAHCHLREPGFEYKGTVQTETRSAVAGGFTTICPMPNTKPVPDNPLVLKEVIKLGRKANLCEIRPFSSVTVGEKGEKLVDFKRQLDAGAIAFSDDGVSVENAALMREAMGEVNALGSFISQHCEEPTMKGGKVHAGEIAERLRATPVLPEAEALIAARDIAIAGINGWRTHLCHISLEATVEMVRIAKQMGVKVTAETCPHYFSFTTEEVLDSWGKAIMNPPLRDEKDRQAIIKGLQDGTIDILVTDHAPHDVDEKRGLLDQIQNGIIGFETALPAALTTLVRPKLIKLPRLVELMSYNPARLLGLDDRGIIAPGMRADITVVDIDKGYIYTEDRIHSKAKNSPWLGKRLHGDVRYTMVKGQLVFQA